MHSFYDLVHSFLGRCWFNSQDWRFFREIFVFFASYSVIIFVISTLGWYRHVHGIIGFVRDNPTLISKTAQNNCEALANGFDKEWRNKVKQFQTPIFSRSTKGAWVLRFDDILADALELGALRKDEISLSPEDIQSVAALTPKDIPNEVIHTLIAYYRANKPEDSDWVVLPVSSFDAYFGSTNFSHKWLVKIPDTILTREKQSFGVCRYKINIC